MALVATVTKKAATYVMDKLWKVTLNMVITDGGVEVLNKDYSVRYRTGDSIAAKQAKFIALMQADIDKYKSEQTIFDAVALDNIVTNIETSLNA